MKRIEFILIIFIFSLGCRKTPTAVNQIELREGLSESEFRAAIIGKWESVFEHPGKQNVAYLELTSQGKAKITITQDGIHKEYSGSYHLAFLRLPSEGSVTLAELTISASTEMILLSGVNFGLHNALSAEEYFLRIDEEPYGVLRFIR